MTRRYLYRDACCHLTSPRKRPFKNFKLTETEHKSLTSLSTKYILETYDDGSGMVAFRPSRPRRFGLMAWRVRPSVRPPPNEIVTGVHSSVSDRVTT